MGWGAEWWLVQPEIKIASDGSDATGSTSLDRKHVIRGQLGGARVRVNLTNGMRQGRPIAERPLSGKWKALPKLLNRLKLRNRCSLLKGPKRKQRLKKFRINGEFSQNSTIFQT